MNSSLANTRVAVVGAGMAGAALARALLEEGAVVHVFDKSRGPGGRLAARRVGWIDSAGQARTTAFDHGAPCFSAGDSRFRSAVAQAVHSGVLTTWQPRLHRQSLPWADAEQSSAHFVAAPTMPQWCRHLVDGATTHWQCAVQTLRQGARGWVLESESEGEVPMPVEAFDSVVLALPPAQAAPLLAPHERAWAQRASLMVMQPCWTLMGVSAPIAGLRGWDVARPEPGALAWALRNESRPGRHARCDEAHWVLHAKAGWSRAHLDRQPEWIAAALQQALAEWLGAEMQWQHATVHRWRYAMPQVGRHTAIPRAWWDERLRLGVCGDFLGGAGVEGAWLSAQTLLREMLGAAEPAATDAVAPVEHALS
jgi:renalase